MNLIEDKRTLHFFVNSKPNIELIIPVWSSRRAHPLTSRISFVYYREANGNDGIINFNHIDAKKIDKFDLNIFITETTKVLGSRYISKLGLDYEWIYFESYVKPFVFDEFVESVYRGYRLDFKELNDCVPLMKWYGILKTIPTTTATGTLLLSDFDGYNGYKQITKINDTQFSYSNSATLQSPAQGTMKMLTATRVDFVANIDRLKADYEKTENAINQNWLYVIMGNDETYNNDTTSLDITGQIRENQDFRLNTIQQFNIYAVVPTKNSILAGIESDTARGYIIPILKSIGNYRFPSLFKDNKYQPVIYLGSGEEDYLSTYYIHRFSFSCIGLIQVSDTTDINEGMPLNSIDGNINLSFTANLR